MSCWIRLVLRVNVMDVAIPDGVSQVGFFQDLKYYSGQIAV